MKTDIHVHPILKPGDRSGFETETALLIDCMDRAGIDRANIIPIMYDVVLDEEAIEFLASYLIPALARHPDRFFGMLWLNPLLPIGYLSDTVKKYIIDGPVHGVKLLCELNASDERMEPLAAFLEEYGVPVLIHSWYNNLSANKNESAPRDVARLAAKFPALKIVMAHLRGAGFRGVQDIKKHPNVSIDTSGSESEDGYLAYALRELGPDRVLFGTDYPGRDFSAAIGRIESVEISRGDRDMIFNSNAEKFLRGSAEKRGQYV